MMAYLYLFIIFLYNSDGVPLVMRVIIIFLGLFIHLGSLM